LEKNVSKIIDTTLNDELPPRPNTITFRIWHKNAPGERRKIRNVTSEGHISLDICLPTGERKYISLYPIPDAAPLKAAGHFAKFVTTNIHVPGTETKAAAFMPLNKEAALLLMAQNEHESYHYYEMSV
jgi:hypothetical protein